MQRHQNWIMVANTGKAPIIFRRGARVAVLNRADRASLNVLDVDMDAMATMATQATREQALPKSETAWLKCPHGAVCVRGKGTTQVPGSHTPCILKTCEHEARTWATGRGPKRIVLREPDEGGDCLVAISCPTDTKETSMAPPTDQTDRLYAAKPHLKDICLGDTADFKIEGVPWQELDRNQLAELKRLVLRNHECYETADGRPTKATGIECRLQMVGKPNLHARRGSTNPVVRKEIERQVKKQKDLGIIRDSCSPYSSTVLLVPKPGGGTAVLCRLPGA